MTSHKVVQKALLSLNVVEKVSDPQPISAQQNQNNNEQAFMNSNLENQNERGSLKGRIESTIEALKELNLEVDSRSQMQPLKNEYSSLSPNTTKIKAPTSASSGSRKNAQREQNNQDQKKPQKTSMYGGNMSISQKQIKKQRRQVAEKVVNELNTNIPDSRSETGNKDQESSLQEPTNQCPTENKKEDEQVYEVNSESLMKEKQKLQNQLRKRHKKRAPAAAVVHAPFEPILVEEENKLALESLNDAMPNISYKQSEAAFQESRDVSHQDKESYKQGPVEQPSLPPSRSEQLSQRRTKKPPKIDKEKQPRKPHQEAVLILSSQSAVQIKQKHDVFHNSKQLKKDKSIKERIHDVIDDRGSDLSEQEILSEHNLNESPTRDLILEHIVLTKGKPIQPFTSSYVHLASASKVKTQNQGIQDRIPQSQSQLHSHSELSSKIQSEAKTSHSNAHQSQQKTNLLLPFAGSQKLLQDNMNQWAHNYKSEYQISSAQDKILQDFLVELIPQNLSNNSNCNIGNLLQKNEELNNLDTFYRSANEKTQDNIFHADNTTRLKLINKWDNKFGQSASNFFPKKSHQLNESSEWDSERDEDCDLMNTSKFGKQPLESTCSQPILNSRTRGLVQINSKTQNEHQLPQPIVLNTECEQTKSQSYSRKRPMKHLSQKQSMSSSNGLNLVSQFSGQSSQQQFLASHHSKMAIESGNPSQNFKSTFELKKSKGQYEENFKSNFTDKQKSTEQLGQDNLNDIINRIRHASGVPKADSNPKSKSFLNSSTGMIPIDQANSSQLKIYISEPLDNGYIGDIQKQSITQKASFRTNREFLMKESPLNEPLPSTNVQQEDHSLGLKVAKKKIDDQVGHQQLSKALLPHSVMNTYQSKGKIVVLKPSQIVKVSNPSMQKFQQKQIEQLSPRKIAPIQHLNNQNAVIQPKVIKQLSKKENDTFDYNWDDDSINIQNGRNTVLKPKAAQKQLEIKVKYERSNQQTQLENASSIQSIADGNLNSVRQVVESAQLSIWD